MDDWRLPCRMLYIFRWTRKIGIASNVGLFSVFVATFNLQSLERRSGHKYSILPTSHLRSTSLNGDDTTWNYFQPNSETLLFSVNTCVRLCNRWLVFKCHIKDHEFVLDITGKEVASSVDWLRSDYSVRPPSYIKDKQLCISFLALNITAGSSAAPSLCVTISWAMLI